MYFSIVYNGFFEDDDPQKPVDSMKISDDLYNEFFESGQTKTIVLNLKGELFLVDKPKSDIYEWDGEKWIISEEKQAELFKKNKEYLLLKIANIVDETKSKMLVGYSQAEIESFYKQEQEALAYQADNSAATPMLRQIAENRGVQFEILVQKVIEKSNLFAAAIGSVIGQRQKFEDRIEAAENQEQLDEIEKEIEKWKN